MPRQVSDSDAYVAMHALRVDHAVGKFDSDQQKLAMVRSVLGDVDGVNYCDILDTPQIDALAVSFAMDSLTDEEKASVISKHPAIAWEEKFTSEAFIHAIAGLSMDQKETLENIGHSDLACVEWAEFSKVRFNELPVGLFLKELVATARGG